MRIIKKMCMAFLAVFLILLSVIPAYAQSAATVNIPVRSSYTGVPTNKTETLTYVLKADDESFPMPEESLDGEKDISIFGNNEQYFGDTVYPRVGIYTYTVYQKKGNDSNCIYDSIVYTLTVSVINSAGGSLQAIPFFTRPDSEFKWERAEFVNQYYSKSGGLSVVKEVNRGTAKADDELIYKITVTNNGSTKLQGIRVRDYIPKYTLFQRINDNYGLFGSIEDHDHVSWFIPELDVGKSIVLSFTVLVDDCIPKDASIKNTAFYEVTGDPTHPPLNNPDDPPNLTNEVDTPQPRNAPKTGDYSNLPMYVSIIFVSSLGLLASLLIRKRQETKNDSEEMHEHS